MSVSGTASCMRMRPASIPESSMNTSAVAPYSTPMRLWSTVVIQLHKPAVAEVGRGSTSVIVAIALFSSDQIGAGTALSVPRAIFYADSV